MDFRFLVFIKDVRKLSKEFERWRDVTIKVADSECAFLKTVLNSNHTSLVQRYINVINFPKTIVRLTRQMCSCNDYCMDYSMYYTKFNNSCPFYDLKNLYKDDRYYSSKIVDKKIIYLRLENENALVDELELKNDIYNNLVGICNDKKGRIVNLKCNLYELRDYCKSDITCFNRILDKNDMPKFLNSPTECKNDNFKVDIENLEDKIYLPFHINSRQKRQVIFKQQVSNSSAKLSAFLYFIIMIFLILIYVKKEINNVSALLLGILIFLGVLSCYSM